MSPTRSGLPSRSRPATVGASADDVLSSSVAGPTAIRAAQVRVGGFAAGALLSLAASALLFRHLGITGSGHYVTVQAIAIAAAGMTDGGLTALGMREHAVLVGAKRDAVLRDLLGLRIALTTVGVIAAVGFTAVAGYGGTIVAGAAIAGIAVWLTAITHQLAIGLTAQLRQGWATAADVLRQALGAGTIALLVLEHGDFLSFIWAGAIACAFALVLIAVVTRGTVPLRPTFDARRWRRVMSESFAYSTAAAVGAIYYRLAIVLVSLIASGVQTGFFSVASRGVDAIIAIPVLLASTLFPVLARAARDDRSRLGYALGRITEVNVVLGLGVALALAAGAPFAIKLVAGPAFSPAVAVLRIQGVGLCFSFLASGWGFAALSLRRHRGVLLANLAALVVCGTLVPLLTTIDGARGAAVATTISEAVIGLGYLLTLMRAGIALQVDAMRVTRVLGVSGGAATTLWLPGVSSPVHVVIAGGVYLVGLIAIRALPGEVHELVDMRGLRARRRQLLGGRRPLASSNAPTDLG